MGPMRAARRFALDLRERGLLGLQSEQYSADIKQPSGTNAQDSSTAGHGTTKVVPSQNSEPNRTAEAVPLQNPAMNGPHNWQQQAIVRQPGNAGSSTSLRSARDDGAATTLRPARDDGMATTLHSAQDDGMSTTLHPENRLLGMR